MFFCYKNSEVNCNKTGSAQIHNIVSNILHFPVTVVIHKNMERYSSSNGKIKEIIGEIFLNLNF